MIAMKKIIHLIIFLAVITLILAACKPKGTSGTTPSKNTTECSLMQHKVTGEIKCFGCGTASCIQPTADWKLYERPEVGILYNCYPAADGCELVQ